MKRLWLQLTLATIVSLLGGALFYTALRKAYPDWSQLNSIDTAISIVVALLSGVAAWLFLQGVSSFKQEFRRAYFLLCVGIVLFGVAQAQYPIASYFNATFWYLDGFIALPYLVAAGFIFAGARALVRVLGIRTRWSAWWAVIAAAIVGVGAVAFLPHARSDYPAQQIMYSNMLTTANIAFFIFAMMSVLRVADSIAQMYVRAMQWLAAALGMGVFAGVHYVVVNLLFARRDNWYFYDSVSIWGFLLTAVLLARAGYAMVLVGAEADAETTPAAQDAPATAELPVIDIIVYLASLASKPKALDPTLDTLRRITARLQPGEPITPQDVQALVSVYRSVESYLTHDDPLRAFSVPELRLMVSHKFNLNQSAADRLWPPEAVTQ
jgi:hypothetical protein